MDYFLTNKQKSYTEFDHIIEEELIKRYNDQESNAYNFDITFPQANARISRGRILQPTIKRRGDGLIQNFRLGFSQKGEESELYEAYQENTLEEASQFLKEYEQRKNLKNSFTLNLKGSYLDDPSTSKSITRDPTGDIHDSMDLQQRKIWQNFKLPEGNFQFLVTSNLFKDLATFLERTNKLRFNLENKDLQKNVNLNLTISTLYEYYPGIVSVCLR